MHATLNTTHGPEYSTVYIRGYAIPDKQWRALGNLAAEVRAAQRAASPAPSLPLPIDSLSAPRIPGWSITAPTEDIRAIESAAQTILSGQE